MIIDTPLRLKDTMTDSPRFAIPNHPFDHDRRSTPNDDPLAGIFELERATDQTHKVWRLALATYEMAVRDSSYDDLDRDPQVVATRETRDTAHTAYMAALSRLEDVLAFEPRILTRDSTTPQSRRSLAAWAADRGGAEELTLVIRSILVALSGEHRVKIEII